MRKQTWKAAVLAVAMGMFAGGTLADGAKQMALMSVGYSGTDALTNFQALVKLPDGVEGFSYDDYSARDGSDIWFTDSSGNVIPHEIDTWNPSGESLVWVTMPVLESSTSYVVMHWGEARGEHVTGDPVWNGFIGVWHMGTASGSANEPDATGHGLNAVPTPGVLSNGKGNVSQMTVTDGVVGNARFNQTGKTNHNGLKVPNYSAFISDPATFSVSGWWKLTGASSIWPRFIAQRPGTSSGAGSGWEIECYVNATTKISGVRAGNDMNTKLGEFTVPDMSQNWIFLTVVFSGADVTIYSNGAKLGAGTLPVNTASNEGCMIGNLGVRASGWYGKYDEVRLYNGAQSADRVKADYDTMSNPTAFLSSVDLSAIVVASWTGGAGDGSVANPANWNCVNGYGQQVPDALPTQDTYVSISGSLNIQIPSGTSLTAKSVHFGDCTLAADCDWRGLSGALMEGRIDLAGHRLYVAELQGTGVIASSGPVPEIVLTGARLWLDASEPSTFSYNPDGTIYSWLSKSSRYIAMPLATSYNGPTLSTMENGRPTVDFGDVGSGKDMRYSRFGDIRTVFLVVKIAKTMDAFLLGDYNGGKGSYQFHRGPNGQYGHPLHSKFDTVWNGETLVDWQTDVVPDDSFQIISIVTTQACSSDSLTKDRATVNNGVARDGGRQLSELITFDRVLNDDERLEVTRYLRQKWFEAEAAATPAGELHIDVADANAVVSNATMSIVGNVKVVKDGAGTFVAAKAGQCYYGGNDVEAGTFRVDGDCSYYCVFSNVAVKEGAIFDLDGCINHNGPVFELAGGRLWSGRDYRENKSGSAIKCVRLTADSVMGGTMQCSLAGLGGTPVTLDMGGRVLTLNTNSDATNRFSKLTVTGGGKIVANSGFVQFGISERRDPIAASGTALEIQGASLVTYAPIDIGDYICAYTGGYDAMVGDSPIRVHGVFTPAGLWHESVMMDGSIIDLSAHEGVWNTACTFTESAVTRHVTFADNATITLNLQGRRLGTGAKVVAWDNPPANLSTLTFQLDAKTARYHALVCREDGIHVFGGLMIIVR